MNRHWDVGLGTAGTFATIKLGAVNEGLATAAGLLTIFILSLRAVREWRNRNTPRDDS